MAQNHYHKGTTGKPRSGLIGTAKFDFQPNLITPLSVDLVGESSFEFGGTVSPGVAFSQIDASGTLVLDNYDVLSAHLVGQATPIQNISDQLEVVWFLDNIGGGSECCDVSSDVEGITIPELPTDPGPAPSGFVRIYGRDGKLFVRGTTTSEIDLTELGVGGGGFLNIDGGFANAVYLPTQNIDGGFSNSVFSGTNNIDGGDANG